MFVLGFLVVLEMFVLEIFCSCSGAVLAHLCNNWPCIMCNSQYLLSSW